MVALTNVACLQVTLCCICYVPQNVEISSSVILVSDAGNDESLTKFGIFKRQPRTSITSNQRAVLQKMFDRCPTPGSDAYRQLATATGLTLRVIRVFITALRAVRSVCDFHWLSRIYD